MIAIPQKSQHAQGVVLLLIVTMLWGTTFPLVKNTIVNISPGVLIAVRCAIASLIFAVHLRNLTPRLLKDGVLVGILLFASLATQGMALETIAANRGAFIACLNVILVPLVIQIRGDRLQIKTFLCAGLAVIGVGIMSWEGGSVGIGDLWMIADLIASTSYILMLESVASNHPPLQLTAVQIVVIGILATCWTFPEFSQQLEAITTNFIPILYLAIVTAVTTWLATIAQNWISAQETAIIYTCEPVFAATFSFFLLGETLAIRGLIGAGMVLAAMIFSQISINNENVTQPVCEETTEMPTVREVILLEQKDTVPVLSFEQLDKTKVTINLAQEQKVSEVYEELVFMPMEEIVFEDHLICTDK